MNVFISHSQSDRNVARELTNRLSAAGHHVWRDQPAALGESVSEAIATAIECAEVYLILISPHLLDSEFSLLEIGGALAESESSGKLVIPVLLNRDVEVPALLRDRVYVDLSDRKQRQHGFEAIETALQRDTSDFAPKRTPGERPVELFAAAERYLSDEIDQYLSSRARREQLLHRWSRAATVLTFLAALLGTLLTWVASRGNGLLVSLAPPVLLMGGAVIGFLVAILGRGSLLIRASRPITFLIQGKRAASDGHR